ncbi:MAG: GNAT family N-acetyltransferase [Oscillospiraceae bacterium]
MKPYVKNNLTGQVELTVSRRLGDADILALSEVQDAVALALEDDRFFVANSAEELAALPARGELFGIFASGKLCAACALLRPGQGSGLSLDLELVDDVPCTAELESYFVLPEYRGNGLGGELVRFAVRCAFEEMGARYIAATVSPRNYASIVALMSEGGFRIRALKLKYGGKLRYIMLRARDDSSVFTVYERFNLSDIYGISKLLTKKYEGMATFSDENGGFLWLAK